jgi:hypothetical protein
MLEKAEDCGLALPQDWRMRYPVDPCAPSVGTWRGWGKIFVLRSRRRVGADPSERLHSSAKGYVIKEPRSSWRMFWPLRATR